jgi:hypothetical protein
MGTAVHVHTAHGAQINFEDLTPCLTCVSSSPSVPASAMGVLLRKGSTFYIEEV